MNYDPTERIMEIFGIPGFWNLVWIIPFAVLIGLLISAYWPDGKGFEGPPYVGFDPGEDHTGKYEFDDDGFRWMG